MTDGGMLDSYTNDVHETNIKIVSHTAVQTMNMLVSSSNQTEEYTTRQSTFAAQFPSQKKKLCQTVKISTDTKDIQTDKTQKMNKSTSLDTCTTSSMAVMTESPFTVDKDTMTLPPIGRHVQTDDVNFMLKRNGKTFKKMSTQCDHTPTGHKDTLENIHQMKTSLANTIAEKALAIKYKQCIGNIT